ncbi:MAG: 2Fe-2S iron-sulfur cluster-binding protein [Gammaproteobacteria bacterium]
MEHKVTLDSNKQTFMVQENETILEAAIRAGVSINYGCSSGTCGLCKARLLKGSVEEIKAREFVIPEAEKLQGNMLTCVCAIKNDVVIDAVVANTVSDIPKQKLNVKVRKVEPLAEEVYRLIVQTPRTSRLRFLAGQYVEIGLDDIGVSRFSIASCPCEDRLIELHLRVSDDDPVSKLVSAKMRMGDGLNLQGPYGEFVYDENANRPVILFAFDTGFAAIKSLLEHITAQEQELHIHLIWMSCGRDGLYLNNLCRSWSDAFDNFTYSGISLDESIKQLIDNPQQGCATVEAHITQVLQPYDDLSCHDVYVSAPAPATKLFENVCRMKNVLMRRFFTEPVRGNEDMSCMVSVKPQVYKEV